MTVERSARGAGHRPPAAERRGDIQGMRTVSALLVAAFHLWFTGISGGVDVFFVVAGYFMTRGALRRIEAGGRLDVAAVWSQIATRIVPNLILCLIGILLLIFLFVDGPQRAAALRHVIASALYVENYYLVWLALAPATRHAPQVITEHLWALGLIGQGYLLLPLLFAIIVRFAQGDPSQVRKAAFATLAAVTALSFAYGLHATARNPDAAYYALLPRLWQFTIGAMLALVPAIGPRLPRIAAAAGSWLGLALLASCGLLIGGWAAFPGVAALWPTAAGALVLCCGRENDPANAGWLLSRRPLQALGDYSYGFYIWHWPLAFLALTASGWASLSWTTGGAIIAASFALAALTDIGSRRLMAAPWLAASAARRSLVLVAMLALIAVFAAAALTAGL